MLSLDELLLARETILKLLKENLEQAQNRMKQRADISRADREFQVGEEIFLRLQSYRQSSVQFRHSTEMAAPRFYGFFTRWLLELGQFLVFWNYLREVESTLHVMFPNKAGSEANRRIPSKLAHSHCK